MTLIKDTPLFDMVDSDTEEWIKIDKDYRAYESFSYTHQELIAMQEYAKSRMNQYLSQHSTWEKTVKDKEIEKNRNIYKDVR